MKRGFTLVELLAVIAILGVIALIAIPAVDKALDQGKDQLLETQKAQMIKGAKDYLAANIDELPSSGSTIILTVRELQDAGFLQLNIRNPKSDDYVAPSAQISVKAVGNGFQYEVLEETMTTTPSGENGPVIVLNGGTVQYVELGTTFIDNGFTATSEHGANITGSVNQIIKDEYGNQVPSVLTNYIQTYTITYSVVDPNDATKTDSVTRTVMVVDTTKPVITLSQESLQLSAINVSSYNFSNLVTATDNSGNTPTINYTSNISQIAGNYTVTYIAKDGSGNVATKKLYVTVTDGISFSATDANVYANTKTVTIKFPTISGKNYTNQYSLDYGNTWITVSGTQTSFTIDKTSMIIARLAEGNDAAMSVTYTITKFMNE